MSFQAVAGASSAAEAGGAAERGGAGKAECPVCKVTWVVEVDRRSDAVYCSRRCMVRASRARKKTLADQEALAQATHAEADD
ncbi:hypothetical protein ACGFSI_23000 [Streptomyces virginiae]|uniref:hypothetical protein n=1 Tax=Streptomyces virginiae TaxID=1961 RepID=UPI00372404A8